MRADFGPPLENNANKVSPLQKSPENQGFRRKVRFDRREVLWTVSSLKRVRHCGRVLRSNQDGATLRLRDGRAGFSGLQHCGSVWADPVCAGRILQRRALEIGAVLGEAIAAGYSLAFITLTMRHHLGQPLELLWKAAQKGWKRSITGKSWTAVEHLVEGWVRVWEVTYGSNGWHLHVHCVMVLPRGAGEAQLERVASGMFGRWSSGLQAAGLSAPLLRGQDWHLVQGDEAACDLGRYLAKLVEVEPLDRATTLGLELTHNMSGRSLDGLGTEPVWSILDRLVRTGEADALDLWHEWERVSRRKRQIGWSTGLRDRFAPELEEVADEDIVKEELGTEADDIFRFDHLGWRAIVSERGRCVELLELCEAYDFTSAYQLLQSWGVAPQVVGNIYLEG